MRKINDDEYKETKQIVNKMSAVTVQITGIKW